MEQLVVLPWLRVVAEEYHLEEELVVALLENDDDEREEEIIFAGERTRITTGILFCMVFLSKEDQKRIREKEKKEQDQESLPKP